MLLLKLFLFCRRPDTSAAQKSGIMTSNEHHPQQKRDTACCHDVPFRSVAAGRFRYRPPYEG
jgi:hypothetical protein